MRSVVDGNINRRAFAYKLTIIRPEWTISVDEMKSLFNWVPLNPKIPNKKPRTSSAGLLWVLWAILDSNQ